VLVHGAFMGAWAWDAVAAKLRADGAKVTAVELPAHGADRAPVSGATLDAYVAKVEGAIDAAGEPVILVGHSMGGVVITQVAEQRPDKIAKLVYVAAILPKDGQSLQDLASKDAGSHLGPALTPNPATGTGSVAVSKLRDIFCADCTDAEEAAIESHYRDEPLAPFVTPVHLTAASYGRVTKFYIYTKQDLAVSYNAQQSMTAGVTFASTATLDTSHSPFLSRPDAFLAALLGF